MPDHGLQLERLTPFYPGQFGVPGSDVSYGIRTASGNVYYVGDDDATYYDANDNHDGTNPIYPKATIQAGLDACTNDRGDMVVLLADNYELTESLTITVDRVRLISWDYLRGESAPSVAIQSATDDFTLCDNECRPGGNRGHPMGQRLGRC
ncbi:MAG: hypothetical protein GWN93_14575 [Deltaproteobacteria bacterium]|nr:hypothetical protein [Deltaproteobacteria bacterium]